MLRNLNNRRAQAAVGEYVLTIFLVLAVVTGMTVYWKRAIQGRIHDARDYMVNSVRQRTAGSFTGDLYLHYEPYYTNTSATVSRSVDHTSRLLPGMSSGIYRKTINESTAMQIISETAPPRDFNLTTPTSN